MAPKKVDNILEMKIDTLHDMIKDHIATEDSQISKLDSKFDKLDDKFDDMNNVLVRQQVILDEHVKRTNLLEEKHDNEVGPLKIQAGQIKLFMKVAAALLATGGAGFGVKQLIVAIFGS